MKIIILFPKGRDMAVWNAVKKNARWNEQIKTYNQQILQYGHDESFINVRELSVILIIFLLKSEKNTAWEIWYKLK